ncbi:unnamed protein product, partial [Brassicogethes aeneus]
AYKFPKIKHENAIFRKGLAYSYMTSKENTKWILSENSINTSSSLIGNALSNLYTNENIFHILYNDQPPVGETSEVKGHTKGVVLANENGGIWLIHSTPHFPPIGRGYSYPKTGTVYGQSFLCISLDVSNLNEVGQQLKYNEPFIYSTNIPDILSKKFPDLVKAADNVTIKNAPWYRQTNLQTIAGQQFVSFAKSKNFGKDLYSSWVSTVLKSDLFVETWRKGPGNLPSNCNNNYKVNNVKQIKLQTIRFLTTEDHSKWAVSENLEHTQWVCIGDINRQEHQLQRGGGTVCVSHKNLSTNYLKSVIDSEQC